MPVEILGALVIGDFGAPSRLRVWQEPDPNGSLIDPHPEDLPHCAAREALNWAHLYVSSVIGWPSSTRVKWSLAHAVDPAFALPPLRGPSLFGTFCLAFLQSVVAEAPGSVKPWAEKFAPVIADTVLNHVAVSAGFEPFSGRFDNVGSIELKLAELTRAGAQTCKLCVVPKLQPIQLELVTETHHEYEVYRIDGKKSVPVVRAIDPLDAIQRIFTLQAVSGLTCL